MPEGMSFKKGFAAVKLKQRVHCAYGIFLFEKGFEVLLNRRKDHVRVHMKNPMNSSKCTIPAKIIYEDDKIVVIYNWIVTNASQMYFMDSLNCAHATTALVLEK